MRGSGVRISPSAPRLRPANRGLLAVSAFILLAFSCCKALQPHPNEISGLPKVTIYSAQHGASRFVPASRRTPTLFDPFYRTLNPTLRKLARHRVRLPLPPASYSVIHR